MRNLIILTSVFFTFLLISCNKEKSNSESRLESTEGLSLRQIIENPLALNVENLFFVKKEKYSFGNGAPELTFAGHVKSDFKKLTINNSLIPVTKPGTFYASFAGNKSSQFISPEYRFVIDDRISQEINDISIELIEKPSTVLSEGDVIEWVVSPAYTGNILLVFKQSSIKDDGTVIQNPKFDYRLVSGNSFVINREIINFFMNGDEIMVTVAAGNIIESNNIVFATTSIHHSPNFTIVK